MQRKALGDPSEPSGQTAAPCFDRNAHMTKPCRREAVALLAAAAACAAAPAAAQLTRRLPVVALILSSPSPAEMAGENPSFFVAREFLHGLRDLGWIDGRNVIVERRTMERQPARAPAILADLIARGVDVIFVGATDWLRDAALAATRTIPIVAVFPEDPVETGHVASLARPGGNLTGGTTSTGREMYDKRFELLKEIAPQSSRVVFLGRQSAWSAYRSGADVSASASTFVPAERPEDLDQAFATVARARADALMVSLGPFLFDEAPRIARFALEHRLPAVFPWRRAVEAGGLLSYGPDVGQLFRQLAAYVDKILKGAKPAELPIEQPKVFELVVNAKTAKALGLTIPPAILLRADEVIE